MVIISGCNTRVVDKEDMTKFDNMNPIKRVDDLLDKLFAFPFSAKIRIVTKGGKQYRIKGISGNATKFILELVEKK